MEGESNPRVVLLNDWRGTVVGLAYDSDSHEAREASPIFTLEHRYTNLQDSGSGVTGVAGGLSADSQQQRSSTDGAFPRVASHVLERLMLVARKCLFKTTVEEHVEKLFADDVHTKERAACALADLSLTSREHKLKITETPRALEGLVNLLQLNSAGMTHHEVQCAKAQTEATRALVSLACEQENRWIISEYPFALTGLVKVLLTNCDPEARKWAAQALGNLCTHSREVRLKIGEVPNALAGLVRLVNKDKVDSVREQAARTLAILMKGQQENKEKIAKIPHAVASLVRLLAPHESLGAQRMGALALASLNYSEDILLEIANTPGAVTALVGLLSADERARHKLEYAATAAAGSSTRAHHGNRRKAVEDDEAPPDKLATLVGVLVNQENPNSQKRTAIALANIYLREKVFSLMTGTVGLGCSRRGMNPVEHMAHFEGGSLNMEDRAVNVLHFLAAAREKKMLMSEYPNAMIGSVGPLPKEGNRDSPTCAFGAMALASLARAHRNRRKIAECPGALAGLVKLLGKTECSIAQAHAACALANIAHGDRQIQYTITRVPNSNVVAALVRMLFKRESHYVQAQAARALACLASVRDRDNNLVIIAKYPNIMTDLSRLLFQSDVPSVQEEAAWALVNIGHRHLGH
ncbi:hypothetical protein MPTK1_7g01150 [Marchantia polymorpha subsp. ruderalis]|nr:hypothetical protein MARPO_0046s0009 [Marchantia polymorpha]BBN15821.1 hypothetical protein Mp_7g01150 [Marchantia polymorpha subsp. ruderalis]|eukprot:PTQ39184.1 hypothetical protein MARPO_0046s0009 [Marchantia polymorpha]